MTVETNPLLLPSALPYHLPDYATIRPEHYLPAFRPASTSSSPRSGGSRWCVRCRPSRTRWRRWSAAEQLLDRVAHAFYTVSSADATPAIQEIDEELAPLMSAHQDAILLDSALYWRVSRLEDHLEELPLDPEQHRLVQRWHREMTLAGAALDDAAKARLTALNQRLSTLSTTFEKNLLADTNDLAVVFDDPAELDGLTAGELSAAARAAAERGLDGRHVLTLPLFTGHPALASLTNRESRRRVMAASRARGSRGNAQDNRAVLAEIAALRAERAALLGYPTHAAAVTADETAGTPEEVERMLHDLAAPAARNAAAERASRQEILDETETEPFVLEAHDWAFYTERLRTARYDIDTAALRPWFEAERVLRDGVFAAARACTGCPSRSAQISSPTTRARGCSRSSRRTGRRSACTSSTSTRATASAAAPG